MFTTICLALLLASVTGNIKKKIDVEKMDGDEIANMYQEYQKKPTFQDAKKKTINLAQGKEAFEGLGVPPEQMEGIEEAVSALVDQLIEKAKDSPSLQKIMKKEMKEYLEHKNIDVDAVWGKSSGEEQSSKEEEEDETYKESSLENKDEL